MHQQPLLTAALPQNDNEAAIEGERHKNYKLFTDGFFINTRFPDIAKGASPSDRLEGRKLI